MGQTRTVDDARFKRLLAQIAQLFGLLGGSGGGTNSSLTQAVWWIDPILGKPNNPGTQALPVDSAATIRSRWNAGIAGVRPTINPTGGVVTFHIVGTLPTSDPLAQLLDVDIANDGTMVFMGQPLAPAHTGTLASASAFARTSAAGQITITDAGVADFHPFVPNLFVDTTSGAVGFLVLPNSGASATGTISPGYSAQTAGVSAFPTPVTVSAGDAYKLQPLASAYLGSTFTVRAFPTESAIVFPQVFFYRLHLTEVFTGDSCTIQSAGDVGIIFQECLLDQGQLAINDTFVQYVNCGFTDPVLSIIAANATGDAFGGFAYKGLRAVASGFIGLDFDFVLTGTNQPHVANTYGTIEVGNTSAWIRAGAGGQALACEGGTVSVGPLIQATAVFYGSVPGGATFITMNTNPGQPTTPGTLTYKDTLSGHAAADDFNFNGGGAATFLFETTPFSVNLATGVYVGPTTCTVTALDTTPAAAGTALAGIAIDLRSGSRIFKH